LADIFISYARADRDRIEKLAAALEAEGCSVWWDRHIAGGEEFSEAIESELAAAKAVVVVWSAESVKSRWVKDEAVTAADAGKLIPICLDQAPAPMGFKQFHVLDLSAWKGSAQATEFHDLLRAVKARLTGEAQAAPAAPVTIKASWTDKLLKPVPLAAMGVAVVALIASVLLLNRDPASSFETAASQPPQDEADEGAATPNLHPEEAQRAVTKDGDNALPPEKSIAVLPFADMSEGGDQAFFADGISEEILNVLVRIPGLKVAGRTSSFSFKGRNEDLREIGATLGVNHLLEGSVRRSGTKLRITAQLIRSEDGFHLWSETYDRELTDIFDIQDEIARAVADQLAISLGLKTGADSLVTDRTDDPVAYENYLRAHQLFLQRGKDNLDLALLLLGEATARDPDFAPAWSVISSIYTVYESYVDDETGAARYKYWRAAGAAAAERAIQLNPNDAAGYSHRGSFYALNFEWQKAFVDFDRSLELAPDNPEVLDSFAQNLIDVGYFDKANQLAKRAVAIDPLVAIYHTTLARTLFQLGNKNEAVAANNKAISTDPQLPFPYRNLWYSYFYAGDLGQLEAVTDAGITAGAFPAEERETMANLRAIWGDEAAMRAWAAPFDWYVQMSVEAVLNDVEGAIAFQEEAWDGPYRLLPDVFTTIALPLFYDHPRWKEQVRRDGMLDLWRARGFPAHCRPIVSKDGDGDDFECKYPDTE